MIDEGTPPLVAVRRAARRISNHRVRSDQSAQSGRIARLVLRGAVHPCDAAADWSRVLRQPRNLLHEPGANGLVSRLAAGVGALVRHRDHRRCWCAAILDSARPGDEPDGHGRPSSSASLRTMIASVMWSTSKDAALNASALPQRWISKVSSRSGSTASIASAAAAHYRKRDPRVDHLNGRAVLLRWAAKTFRRMRAAAGCADRG